MAQVTIVINAREYAIACEDGQERRILELADILETKAQMLKSISGQINENMLLAMIGILVADDLTEARKNAAPPQAIETREPIETADFSKADEEIATRLKNVRDAIKGIAKEIDLL